jgi:hypothetical protein
VLRQAEPLISQEDLEEVAQEIEAEIFHIDGMESFSEAFNNRVRTELEMRYPHIDIEVLWPYMTRFWFNISVKVVEREAYV